jgi:hypothetical protein
MFKFGFGCFGCMQPKPDHNTLARFRKSSSSELEGLFKDSVKLCMRPGLVFLNSVSTVSTKIAAAVPI